MTEVKSLKIWASELKASSRNINADLRHIDNIGQDGQLLEDSIAQATHCTTLNVHGSAHITEAHDVNHLFKGSHRNPAIKILRLHHVKITDTNIAAYIEGLKINTQLEEISIYGLSINEANFSR